MSDNKQLVNEAAAMDLLNNNEWLRTPDVMRITGLCRKTLYRLIDSGMLRAKDIGSNGRRCYMIHTKYLDEFRGTP